MSMLELDPTKYEQTHDSAIYEKMQFLSTCGRRVGEVIAKNFQSR